MRTLALALALWGALAGRCLASSIHISFDPRIELLGVVQYLSASRVSGPSVPAELDLEKEFGAFRGHPAVKTYARMAAKHHGDETYGLISLFLSAPPELRFARDRSGISSDFISTAGGRQQLDEFLAQLRDFAKASHFVEFYARHKADYARYEAAARGELGGRDDIRLVEDYVGRDLQSRVELVLAAAYSPGTWCDYIIPYPYGGPHIKVKGPFEVYALIGPRRTGEGRPDFGLADPMRSGLWNELLYVIVEQGYADYGEQLARYAALEAPVARECMPQWEGCSKHIIVSAIAERLQAALSGQAPGARPGPLGDDIEAMASRLQEYEKDRKTYPTLLDFYPRLVDEFRILAQKAGGTAAKP